MSSGLRRDPIRAAAAPRFPGAGSGRLHRKRRPQDESRGPVRPQRFVCVGVFAGPARRRGPAEAGKRL